ncbi:MAG: hypothetical protein H7836_08205 [Magnetococcus sp. YQC-3]
MPNIRNCKKIIKQIEQKIDNCSFSELNEYVYILQLLINKSEDEVLDIILTRINMDYDELKESGNVAAQEKIKSKIQIYKWAYSIIKIK